MNNTPWIKPAEATPWPQTKVTPWVDGKPIEHKPTLDEVLMMWQHSKSVLQDATAEEMRLRKLAVELGFGAKPKEGTNNLELGKGYVLKAVQKYNYKLTVPSPEYKGNKLDAVEECIDKISAISNEGSFIADRIFTWNVELSLTEYRKLIEEAEVSPIKAKLLAEVNKVVLITDAAPTLEIKPPKEAK